MARLTIYLPDDLHEDLKEVAEGNQSEVVQRALRREFGYELEEDPDVQSLSKQIEEIENRLNEIESHVHVLDEELNQAHKRVWERAVDWLKKDPENDR